MAVLTIETDIIASIAASPTGRAVIMSVESFRNYVIVFIGDQNVFDVTLTDNFQHQNQFLHIRVTN